MIDNYLTVTLHHYYLLTTFAVIPVFLTLKKQNAIFFYSLYPYINKTAEYPVGHPEILLEEDLPPNARLEDYFGIAKVLVHPPRRLLHPVLGLRVDQKLMFPLCRTCANEKQQTECQHSTSERAWKGTYCIPELLKAQAKGYTFSRIYEIYHWSKTSQYDPKTKKGGLFSEYVDLFLKFKQQASDWPSWCTDPSKKAEYIADYYNKEGVTLEADKISHNPGLRTISKTALNSFWGRYLLTYFLTYLHAYLLTFI